ncbi:Anaphase promoting complex subunit 11 [Coemansia sp. RSA 720]|nr:Anaphase promoting complex subunit 11 [Coemansia sp. RSA 720]
MKITITRWKDVAGWKWDVPDDEVCGICRAPFDACCPNCTIPGDDCSLIWGECSHSESSLQAPVESIAHPHAEASIPFDYSSSLTNPNHAAYEALSERYACTYAPDSPQSIIAQLGGDWSAEWQKALDGKGIFAEDNIWSIISIGSRTYDAGQGATRSNLKGLYLNILNALMLDIEESLQRRRICLNSRWSHSHKTSAKDKHMPNGFLHDDTNILGRLLWSFIAMAKNQPRRFTLGFSVSKKGELYVYLCTTEKVCFTYIGVLPYCTVDRSQATTAVRFLLLVYMQLPKDTGILMHKDGNMSGSFRAQDIVNGRSIDLVSDLSDMDITILNGKARSGGHRALFGPRSWIFDASAKSATAAANHILKLHWHDDSSEVAVHAKVTEFKVPHTPQLVGAIAIPARDGGSVAGEMLLLEDVGEDIYTFFSKLLPTNSHQMMGMFAGYFHALLAAATGNGRKFVLHRDVSARNLLVKNTRPFLIDWGCGIVADTDRPRYAPKYSMVGTMPFMGLRVLSECSNRSLIDDLESLLIVFAYCLWLKYGTIPAKDKKYWDGTATTNGLLDFRICWLQCENSFIDRMKLYGCPEELEKLAIAMYGLVYPLSKVSLYNIYTDVTDPRLAIFNAHEWVAAFDTAAASSKSANISCVNLELLHEYVKNTPECNALLIDSVLSQPGLKAKRSDMDDVSTRPKRSRM